MKWICVKYDTNEIMLQGLSYEVCDRTRTPPHTPKTVPGVCLKAHLIKGLFLLKNMNHTPNHTPKTLKY